MTFLLVYASIFLLFIVLIIRFNDFPKNNPSYKSYKEKEIESLNANYINKSYPIFRIGQVVPDKLKQQAVEQSKGFYIYSENSYAKGVMFRLLDNNLNDFLNRDFRSITFNEKENTFHCNNYPPREHIVFDVNKNRIIDLSEYNIRSDSFGNIYYRLEEGKKYGIMDDDYNQITKPLFRNLRGINKNVFFYFNPKTKGEIINELGITLLDNVRSAEFCFSINKYLIKRMDNSIALYNIDFTEHKLLPYHSVIVPFQPKPFEFFLASKESDEICDGTSKRRLLYTLLKNDGEELFSPQYDWIRWTGIGGQYFFEVYKGDILHLEEVLKKYDAEEFASWDKIIKCGVINQNNEIIIPIEYSYLYGMGSNLLLASKNSVIDIQFSQFEAEYDYDEDEEADDSYKEFELWDYSYKGGKWGAINLNSEIIIPFDYNSMMHEQTEDKKNWILKLTKSEDSIVDYYDLLGNKIDRS